MSATQQVLAVCGVAVPLLASVGGVIRQLVRILVSIEHATDVGEQAAKSLREHIEQSGSVHAALTQSLSEHDAAITQLRGGHA